MTIDLVAFLRARLDEDEQVAQCAESAHGPIWKAGTSGGLTGGEVLKTGGFLITELLHGADIPSGPAAHIARHDPTRILAEVETKRRILAEYESVREVLRTPVRAEVHQTAMVGQGAYEGILRLLAMPYAGHRDYRKEWRP